MRAAIYLRISKDEDQDRLGVQRQLQDLRREAQRREAVVVLTLEDNDLSGSGRVYRPAFERLIEAVQNHEVDLVLAVDVDRLFRGFRPFVRFYEACEQARIIVAWLGGEAHFGTGAGIFELELRASFAREELRKIKQRTRRKHQQLAEDGHDAGGGRPFGYEGDRHTIREEEAELVREAARRALGGEPLRAICADWNERGVDAVKGARWSPRVLKRILISARIGGRRERTTVDGKRSGLGEITAMADWPGIISVSESDRLRSLLTAPERRKESHPRKYLLSGLLTCGRCGKPLHTSTARGGQHRSYACISGPGFSNGCGGLRIHAEPLEDLITATLLGAVDEGALTRVLRAREEDHSLADELAVVEARLSELAGQWADGQIIRLEWQAARIRLVERQGALTRSLEAQRRRLSLDGLDSATPLRDRWPDLELHRQRAILMALIELIEIRPATRFGPLFNPSRVEVKWTT